MIKEFKLSQVQEIHPKIYTIVGVIYQNMCHSLRCFMDMNSKSSFSKRNIVTEVGLQGFNVNGSQSLDVLGSQEAKPSSSKNIHIFEYYILFHS